MCSKICIICLKDDLNNKLFNDEFNNLIKYYIGIEFIQKQNVNGLCVYCEMNFKNIFNFIREIKNTHDKLIWNIPTIALDFIKQEDDEHKDVLENLNDSEIHNPHEVFLNDDSTHNFDDSDEDISIHDLKSKKYIKVNGGKCSNMKKNKNSHNKSDRIRKSKRKLSKKQFKYKNKFTHDTIESEKNQNEEISETDLKNLIENELQNAQEKKIEKSVKPDIDIESKYEILDKNDNFLKKHMYKCLTCGILCVNKSAFIVHYRRHTGDRPHSCKFCKMKYTQMGTLNAHLKKRHYKEWVKIKLVAKKVKELKEREFLEEYKVNESNDDEVAVKKRIVCHICGKTYSHKYGLNLHMKVHDVDQQFQCQYCPQKFVRTGDRILHVRIHHTGEKPYCCHICGKKFPSGTNLKKHLVAHSEERKFKCPICSKAMKSNDNLKRHILVMHEGTKNKICHVCGKGFALQYRLNVHMKNWHENKKMPATCDICNKSYRNIEKHMKRHLDVKPHRCTMCHKSFLREKHLLIHTKKHDNETATFKCSYENCTSGFVKKCMLDYHILKYHLKHTPHVCQICDRGFYRSKDLGRHTKLKHNTKLNCDVAKEVT